MCSSFLRLSTRSLPRLNRSWSRTMSTIYVVPVDPLAPSASTSVNIDAPKIWSTVPQGPKPAKAGSTHVFYDTPTGSQHITALSSLGPSFNKDKTQIHTKRELLRTAVGNAVQQIKALGDGVKGRQVQVDVTHGDAHAAAVASHLASYGFNLKTDQLSPFKPTDGESVIPQLTFAPVQDQASLKQAWDEGVVYAEAQNLARTLMELPANMLTPTLFAERIQKEFAGVENVEIIVRDTSTFYAFL